MPPPDGTPRTGTALFWFRDRVPGLFAHRYSGVILPMIVPLDSFEASLEEILRSS